MTKFKKKNKIDEKKDEEVDELTKTLLEIKKKYGDKSITYADKRK